MKVRDLTTASNPETVHPTAIVEETMRREHLCRVPAAGDVTMSTLQVLATLAIAVGCAPLAVCAEQPSSARMREPGGVVAAALTEPAPRTGPAHASPESCPYRFDSDMPAATFCVYRGVAFGRAGEVCATDVVVIWSSLGSQVPVRRGPTGKTSTSNREVNLGFVTDPELVVGAIVDPRQIDRAEIVGYALGDEEAPQALAGQITLLAVRPGSGDVLRIDLRKPGRFHIGSCAFASYSGTFLGMLRPPSEMTTSVDRTAEE